MLPDAPFPPKSPSRQGQGRWCQRGTEGGRGARRRVRCSWHPGWAAVTPEGVVWTRARHGDLLLPEEQE